MDLSGPHRASTGKLGSPICLPRTGPRTHPELPRLGHRSGICRLAGLSKCSDVDRIPGPHLRWRDLPSHAAEFGIRGTRLDARASRNASLVVHRGPAVDLQLGRLDPSLVFGLRDVPCGQELDGQCACGWGSRFAVRISFGPTLGPDPSVCPGYSLDVACALLLSSLALEWALGGRQCPRRSDLSADRRQPLPVDRWGVRRTAFCHLGILSPGREADSAASMGDAGCSSRRRSLRRFLPGALYGEQRGSHAAQCSGFSAVVDALV